MEPASNFPKEAKHVSLEARYLLAKELYLTSAERQYSYGKWVLASLLTVHGGSLLAISQAGEATVRLYQACGPLLIYGLAVTLIAGGLAWINFSFATNVYAHAIKDLLEGRSPDAQKVNAVAVSVTFWLTPFLVIAALVLFVIAAVRATAVL